MAGPSPEQWRQVYNAMAPHVQFFSELHRRLQRIGLHGDHRYLLALDRALDRLGTVAPFTAGAAGRREWQMDDLAFERPEW